MLHDLHFSVDTTRADDGERDAGEPRVIEAEEDGGEAAPEPGTKAAGLRETTESEYSSAAFHKDALVKDPWDMTTLTYLPPMTMRTGLRAVANAIEVLAMRSQFVLSLYSSAPHTSKSGDNVVKDNISCGSGEITHRSTPASGSDDELLSGMLNEIRCGAIQMNITLLMLRLLLLGLGVAGCFWRPTQCISMIAFIVAGRLSRCEMKPPL
jgi:hypothetical protein